MEVDEEIYCGNLVEAGGEAVGFPGLQVAEAGRVYSRRTTRLSPY